MEKHCLFTIGYEGSSQEEYIKKLTENKIKLLIDVRRNPISRKKGFSKKQLMTSLAKCNIQYKHIPELGICSSKRKKLQTTPKNKLKMVYHELFEEYTKTILSTNKPYLIELLKIFLEKKRIGLTCFEADHTMCHRGKVVTALQNTSEWNKDYLIKHL